MSLGFSLGMSLGRVDGTVEGAVVGTSVGPVVCVGRLGELLTPGPHAANPNATTAARTRNNFFTAKRPPGALGVRGVTGAATPAARRTLLGVDTSNY
jgi:hypothetical protein